MSALQIVMTKTEATAITTRIKLLVETIASNTEKVVTLIEQAEAGEAWRALDYPSWTAYVAAEFTGALKALEKAERIPVMTMLADTGMSTRAIATVVGVNNATVSRDLAGVADATPAVSVTGTDGKTYTRSATFLRSGKPDARSTSEMGQAVPPVARKASRRPLTEQYRDAVYDLQKVVERLERLTADDRFSGKADALYDRNGATLERVAQALHDNVRMPLVRGDRDV